MKENKGFTLIELLAVIVILAIIALIATPVIMKIINDSRQSAAEESAKLMVSQAELAYNAAYLACDGNAPAISDILAKFEGDGVTINTTANTLKDGLGTTCTLAGSNGSNLTISCVSSNSNQDFKNAIVNIKQTSDSMLLGDCNKPAA